MGRTCLLPTCDADLTGRRANAKYCKDKHRLDDFRIRQANGDGPGTFQESDPVADPPDKPRNVRRGRSSKVGFYANRIERDWDFLVRHADPKVARDLHRKLADRFNAEVRWARGES
jgi:hypothetical protein